MTRAVFDCNVVLAGKITITGFFADAPTGLE
jgi:hypothetical protein